MAVRTHGDVIVLPSLRVSETETLGERKQASIMMTQFAIQSHYPDTELTSPLSYSSNAERQAR